MDGDASRKSELGQRMVLIHRRWFTYMVRCVDGSLYTGFTVDDVERRVAAHNAGKGAKYTKSRRPVTLVWYDEWKDETSARRAEWRVKRLSKREKEALTDAFGKGRACTILSERQDI